LLPLILVLAFLVCVGCSYQEPIESELDFTCDDPELTKIVLDAAQEWTDAGVVKAAMITVNVNPKGIPIKWADGDDLPKLCNVKPQAIKGCVSYKYDSLFFNKALSPDWLRIVVMHELIHAIVPTKDHLPKELMGIMNVEGNNDGTITQNDLDFLSDRGAQIV